MDNPKILVIMEAIDKIILPEYDRFMKEPTEDRFYILYGKVEKVWRAMSRICHEEQMKGKNGYLIPSHPEMNPLCSALTAVWFTMKRIFRQLHGVQPFFEIVAMVQIG